MLHGTVARLFDEGSIADAEVLGVPLGCPVHGDRVVFFCFFATVFVAPDRVHTYGCVGVHSLSVTVCGSGIVRGEDGVNGGGGGLRRGQGIGVLTM